MRHGPSRRRGPVRHADLRVDVGDVVLGGPRRDEQLGGDLVRRAPARHETEHLELTPAQTTRTRRTVARGRLAPGGVDLLTGVDRRVVEVEGRTGGFELR